jgi:redox-sensitive bicupin YhaK (pirin superfamily)
MQIRKSDERGHFENSWLNTKYSFSFSDYFDPNFMSFQDLRVINEDMEIISYIVTGAIAYASILAPHGSRSSRDPRVWISGR